MINTIEIKDMDKLITAMGGTKGVNNGSVAEVPAGIWVPVPEAAEAGYVLTAKADGTVEWVDPSAEVTAKKTTKKN